MHVCRSIGVVQRRDMNDVDTPMDGFEGLEILVSDISGVKLRILRKVRSEAGCTARARTMDRTVVAETDGFDGVTSFEAPSSVLGVRIGGEEASRPEYSCLYGAGACLSTPTDVVRFGSAMLKPGRLTAVPDLGLAIAAAANTTDARGVNPFALKVVEAFTRQQIRLPPPMHR